MELPKCYICDIETEFECQTCENPTCENCLTPYTLQNQVDYCLCNDCYDTNQIDMAKQYYIDNLSPEEYKKHLHLEKRKRQILKFFTIKFG